MKMSMVIFALLAVGGAWILKRRIVKVPDLQKIITCVKGSKWREQLKNAKQSNINIQEIDVMTFRDIIIYFKDLERSSLLKKNAQYIPVAIKENCSDGILVLLTLFDTRKKTCALTYTYKAKELDESCIAQFGDKDMIVFR